MPKTTKAPVGASLIVLSSFFYASYGIWTKLMGDFFGGYTASALRSVLVVLMLAPFALLYCHFQPLDLQQNWRYLLGLFATALFTWGPLYYAIQHAGVGISLTINYASLLIGAFLFGKLFSGERFTKDKAISAVLGLVGLCLIFAPSTASFGWLALLAACVSGLSIGAVMVLTKKVKYNPTQTTLALWVTSAVSSAVMALVIGERAPIIGLYTEWLHLVFFAIASVVASWALVKGLKLIDAGAAGLLGLLEIVFGVLFGAVLFHERPGLLVLIGVVIIIVAAAIPYLRDYDAQHGKADTSTM
jgi:drug/metabolite transporter (DMT)-like permease